MKASQLSSFVDDQCVSSWEQKLRIQVYLLGNNLRDKKGFTSLTVAFVALTSRRTKNGGYEKFGWNNSITS